MTGVQPPRGPGPSERIRVVVGSRQTPSSFPSSMSHSLGKTTKLRSSQRLQLMKLQAEAESERMPQKKSSAEMLSIPATTNGAFLTNLQHHYSVNPSPRSSVTIPPNLHDYAAMHSRSTIDDEDEMLKDLEGVLGEEFSSYESSFNIPSVANSCIADFPNDLQDVHMEEDKGQTSSSCPLIPLRPAEQVLPYRGGRRKEPPPPVFLSEESKLQWLKEREKKDQHNTIEKKRRSKINDYIHELATLLPENYDIDLQNKKGNILEASVDYIRKLQGEEKRMSQMKKQQDELERQNRKLQLQIQLLQMMNSPQVGQSPLRIPVQQPAAPLMQPPVQFSDVFDLNPGGLQCDTDELDLLSSDLDMIHDSFGLAQLDPIFASLQVETVTIPDTAGSAMAASASQIPVMVDEIMEFNM